MTTATQAPHTTRASLPPTNTIPTANVTSAKTAAAPPPAVTTQSLRKEAKGLEIQETSPPPPHPPAGEM